MIRNPRRTLISLLVLTGLIVAPFAWAATTVTVGTGSGGIGTATVTCTIAGTSNIQGTDTWAPPVESAPNSPLQSQLINLSSGFQTVAVPSTAAGVFIIPPVSNTNSITLKGITGDTGIQVGAAAPIKLTFPNPPPATIGITTGATINGVEFIFY